MIEVRYAGAVVGRSTGARDGDGRGLFLNLAEPLPVGTPVTLMLGDETIPARVASVVESPEAARAGMYVSFVDARSAAAFGVAMEVGTDAGGTDKERSKPNVSAPPAASSAAAASVAAPQAAAPAAVAAAPSGGQRAVVVVDAASGPAAAVPASEEAEPSGPIATSSDGGGGGGRRNRRNRRR